MKTSVEMEQELAAIQMGIRTEFTMGDLSGDILQDFGVFIDHHKQIEKELFVTKQLLVEKNITTFMNQVKRLQAELQEWKDILARRDKHIVDQNVEIITLKTKQEELKEALKPFASGISILPWTAN